MASGIGRPKTGSLRMRIEAGTIAVFDISGSAPVLTALKPLGFIDRSLPGNELDGRRCGRRPRWR
jgi:hypothetical protein